jgi:hypothetical protein
VITNLTLVEAATGRIRLASPRTAVILGGLTLVLLLASVPLSILAHKSVDDALFVPVLWIVPFVCLGLPVARRQPRNPIGWVVLALALSLALWQDAELYSLAVYGDGHHNLPLARLAVALTGGWLALLLLLPLPILLFPDGRLPSRRLRRTVWVYLGLAVVAIVDVGIEQSRAFTEARIKLTSTGDLVNTSHSTAAVTLFGVWFLTYVAVCLSWVIGQVIAYRRSTGERRQQVKWLMFGAVICMGGLVIGLALSNANSPVLAAVSSAGFVAIAALPLGIGVGILKYRLYEIDRLISRTLSYLIVTGLLAAVFVGVVVLTRLVLPFSSPVGVAASTLAAAALFAPLRRRVQHVVDRRFNRTRYDADAIVAAFTLRLRDAVDLDTVRHELLATVDAAVQPAHASVWLKRSASRTRT